MKIVKSVIKDNVYLRSQETIDHLIEFINPLLQDDKDNSVKEDPYEFDEGQNSICKMIHLIYSENNDQWYTLLLKFKKIFIKGGAERMAVTLPALIFQLLKLSA